MDRHQRLLSLMLLLDRFGANIDGVWNDLACTRLWHLKLRNTRH